MTACRKYRRYLYAFADGQLDVQINCELLDHLKMCPACTRIVDEHQALRLALRRTVEAVPLPTGLEARIRRSIRRERRARGAWRWRSLIPIALATAACAALTLNIIWHAGKAESPSGPNVLNGWVMRGDDAAKLVAEKHQMCCHHWDQHQAEGLSKDVATLAEEISGHYKSGLVRALAPNLSWFNFRVESANYCGVETDPTRTGGHIIYFNDETSNRFSFFSIPRFRAIERCGHKTPDGWFENSVQLSDGSDLHVLSWTQDNMTYICCSPTDSAKMKTMVKDVRMAMSRPEARELVAAIWPSR
ncbi:MAG: anti-sigma factor family protein [Phycisphaerae bacterium]